MPYLIGPARLARYFFHECERYLRYQSTPKRQWAVDGVPARDKEHSPVTRSLLEAGFAWEEQVVARLGAVVQIPPGQGPVRDRSWPASETLQRLEQLPAGQYLYQGQLEVPTSFYERYGLDRDLLHFPDCKPDLLVRTEEGLIRVIDVKATDELKPSHRIQVGLYALILREHLGDTIDLEQGGIWLSGQDQSTPLTLGQTLPLLENFMRDRLASIFLPAAAEVPWHLVYRCEWCEYFKHCRSQAEQLGSVSLLPYLSQGGRQFLRSEGVDTLEQFQTYLKTQPERLEGCGSLRGRRHRLQGQTRALLEGHLQEHGGASLALPVREHVRIMLTLQKEPVSGRIYAAGFHILRGKEDRETWVSCAPTQEATASLERDFLLALHREMARIDSHNRGRDWREQLSLQTYVFDSFERELLQDLLLRALDEPTLALPAMQLLFHFQSEELAGQDEHPQAEVPFPVVALVDVVRELVALPFPLALQLDQAMVALRRGDFDYQTPEYLRFELSNALRQDAVLRTWAGQADHCEWIASTLKQRMWSALVVLDGLRSRVRERLFAWPPRFQFLDSEPYRNADLSRLAFVVRYESFLGALAVRGKRSTPWPERLSKNISLPLQYEGGDRWRLLAPVDGASLAPGPMFDRLLVPEGAPGEIQQMAYDDFRQRQAMWAPKSGEVRLARISQCQENLDGTVASLELELKTSKGHSEFGPGDQAVLHSRYIDFTSDKILSQLRELDARGESDFVRLLEGQFDEPVRSVAPARANLTPSQLQALRHLETHRLTVIWGPPGTGKTHFLAHALAALIQENPELRVAITAFTHAAIRNLLGKLQSLGLTVDDKVVAGTVYQLDKKRRKGMPPVDLLVIDEGSQLKLGETALALGVLRPGGRLAVAGDHLQLPPIVQGRYPEPEDQSPGLHSSAFEYLQDTYPSCVCQLTENWRMNQTLTQFPAETLYGREYRPATSVTALQRLILTGKAGDDFCDWLLDPDYPLAMCILENLRATVENPVESELVARLAVDLRRRAGWPSDQDFWTHGLFIVSPHHLQIRSIRRSLSDKYAWQHPPFVDTVDKMQGQESQSVLVSYGVSDIETALAEAEFLYSRNRLNVSLTRARAKCVVFLPRPLLEPGFDLLANPRASEGLGFMHALLSFCREGGEERCLDLAEGAWATLVRCRKGREDGLA